RLAHGLRLEDLYEREGLLRVDAAFVAHLEQSAAPLAEALRSARADPDALAPLQGSELLIALAPYLDDFVAELFGIQAEVRALSAQHHALAPLYAVKRSFVQRRAMARIKPEQAATLDGAALESELTAAMGSVFSELGFAQRVSTWLEDETAFAAQLELAARYAAWAAHTAAGRARHRAGVLFKAPAKLDYFHLVPAQIEDAGSHRSFRTAHLRRRDGFALTDPGTDLTGALDQANYCIWCHEQGRDSCSRGLKEKATGDAPPAFKKTPFGVPLAGCPLEEKISEFHKVKVHGYAIGAVAMIAVDNPLAAATGHRICNDCMKSCIYQKQDPVNIPQAETRTLKDVLGLPWGFEIYGLLTRWNPLDLRRPTPRARSGRRVLVVGLGPAGFSLAHHLMNDGHLVVGIDGLKIEPLPPELSGVDERGARVSFAPVREIDTLYEALDDRVMAGFGGVAEYGITVRWDKNFLKVIRLLLERRAQFCMVGGVRFGGTVTAADAWAQGFDHIALAAGAGRPTVLELPNGLARGVRTASDFLMALQLTGAAKADSVANLQIRLPVVVIGGGLTAIDTATESLAYYPLQVEKFLLRYETLAAERGKAAVRAGWSAEEQAIADEFIGHARALRAERAAAAAEGRAPRLVELLQSWGGATIAYRKRMIDSPSYTLNHEEIEKALEEGIRFAEGLTPVAVEVDPFGHAAGLRVAAQKADEHGTLHPTSETVLPARTILVAAGTQPNTVLAREDGAHFPLDGRYFQACDDSGQPVTPERSAKPHAVRVLLAREPDGRFISFFGDLHPSFFGNVVKAMGGVKQGYPVV
ncbi:MAG TPA: FAD-dependent oxidoreductase, partial [Burkholderiales bacterium]|nr:FAD-dependent oxidoreductase [Burkholderiales bacterium]